MFWIAMFAIAYFGLHVLDCMFWIAMFEIACFGLPCFGLHVRNHVLESMFWIRCFVLPCFGLFFESIILIKFIVWSSLWLNVLHVSNFWQHILLHYCFCIISVHYIISCFENNEFCHLKNLQPYGFHSSLDMMYIAKKKDCLAQVLILFDFWSLPLGK